MMPGMDGHEVLRRLRANSATADIPVIFVTANNSVAGELTGLQGGADDYVSKPVVTAILLQRIRNLLDKQMLRREIEAQRNQLRALLDTIPDLVWYKDGEGRYLTCNPAFERLFGAKEADIIGKTDRDFVAAPLAEYFEEHDQIAIRTGKACTNDEWMTFAEDGHRALLETTKTPMYDRNGQLVGILGIGHDITHLRHVQDLVREKVVQFRVLFDQAPIGIALLDATGHFDQVNARFCEILGYHREELVRKLTFADVTLPEDRTLGQDQLQAVERGEIDRFTLEKRYLRRNGEVIWGRLSMTPLIAEQSKSAGHCYVSLEDISSIKAAETSLRESETLFHTMTDWTYDWEYWIYPNGRLHYSTPSVERLTGYPPEAFEQDPDLINSIVDPEDRHLWERHARLHLHDGSSQDLCEIDFRIRTRQGSTCWVNHSCRPIFSESGDYQGRRVTVRDINARKAAEEQIRHLAYYDPLTDLPNRRLLKDRLEQAMASAQRSREYSALIIIDLDHFKDLNDSLGHDAGDCLLVEVARRLRAGVRQEDTVSRLGGDEFVIMLVNLGREEAPALRQALFIAEKIREQLNQPYALSAAAPAYLLSPSMGITLFLGQDAPADSLFKQADLAMYQAKEAGRNAVRCYNQSINPDATGLDAAMAPDALQVSRSPS